MSVDAGRRLAGRELVGDGPARRFGGRPELPPGLGGVDLDDDAVGVVFEVVAAAVPLPVIGQGLVEGRAEARVGIGREAELLEPAQGAPLALLLPAVDVQGVEEDVEVPGGHLLRIEEADGARRRVPGIGEEGLAGLLAAAVDLAEGGEGQVDLAADLDLAFLGDDERQRADGLDVGADVVAADAVAAGDGPGELAVPVEDGDAEPVDLELGRVGDRAVAQDLADAALELPDLVLVVAVVDAEHRRPVDDGGEALDGLLAHPLGRRFGRHQLGEAGLEAAQLGHEAVELGVGDLGIVVDVVFPLVADDVAAQRLGPGAFLPAGGRGGHVNPPVSRGPGAPGPFRKNRYLPSRVLTWAYRALNLSSTLFWPAWILAMAAFSDSMLASSVLMTRLSASDRSSSDLPSILAL